jgi:hypothetical protein
MDTITMKEIAMSEKKSKNQAEKSFFPVLIVMVILIIGFLFIVLFMSALLMNGLVNGKTTTLDEPPTPPTFMSYLSGLVNWKTTTWKWVIVFLFNLFIFAAGAGFFPISAVVYKMICVELRSQRLEDEQGRLPDDYRDRNGTRSLKDGYASVQNPYSYALLSFLAMLVSIIGISLLLIPQVQAGLVADADTLTAIRYGFLGAYVFSLQLIYRRYTTLDMQPFVYMYCALILIAGIVFNYVAFEAFRAIAGQDNNANITGVGAGLSAILAFSLGYFPNFALQWFNRVASAALGGSQRRADALPLGLIDGISELHELRLRDNGIDNVANLATTEIHDLVINTNFNLQQVVDWVDQALLYLYLEQSAIDNFRRTGIRTFSDFQSLWKKLYVDRGDPTGDQNAKGNRRQEIANQLLITPERLDMIYKSTKDGPNIDYVKQFYNHSSSERVAETMWE